MKFEDWLRKQKKRNDPIGDLANDYIATRSRGAIEKSPHWSGACFKAQDALVEAKKEFEQYKKEIM